MSPHSSHDHVHTHEEQAHTHGISYAHSHTHSHGHGHPHVHGGTEDYMAAVNAYRKTFSNKQRVIEQTPDPAVREMLLHMQEMGLETVFDRFDAQ